MNDENPYESPQARGSEKPTTSEPIPRWLFISASAFTVCWAISSLMMNLYIRPRGAIDGWQMDLIDSLLRIAMLVIFCFNVGVILRVIYVAKFRRK